VSILTPEEVSKIYSERIFDIVNTTRRKRQIVCPLPMHAHHNYTPSFSIYWAGDRWRWQCHGSCQKKGDVIDLVGYMQVPFYDPEDPAKLSEAINILTGNGYQPAPPIPPKKGTALPPTYWQEFYPPGKEVIQYAQKRGISEGTLQTYRIGQREYQGDIWMTIPTFHNDKLIGIKMRNINHGPRYRAIKGSRTGLFNYNGVAYRSGTVYVVKGEIAALVMLERGLLACAPTGGESMKLSKEIRSALALSHPVVIGDNDPDPSVRIETRKLAERRARSLNAELIFPPEAYKDVDEWILDDPGAIEKLQGIKEELWVS